MGTAVRGEPSGAASIDVVDSSTRRVILLISSAGVAAIGVAVGCASSTSNVPAADSGTDAFVADDTPPEEEEDASTPDAGKKDSSTDAGPGVDANGPGQAGDVCSFNRDCQNGLRCECDGECACAVGARGTGQKGVDSCDSGNQCSSALCLEGPDGKFLCSDECVDTGDCPAKLPRCEDVAFVGRICIRQP